LFCAQFWALPSPLAIAFWLLLASLTVLLVSAYVVFENIPVNVIAIKTVATANTAAIETVVFFVDIEREYESIRIFELRKIGLLFRSRYI
jgi:hypothetical protein